MSSKTNKDTSYPCKNQINKEKSHNKRFNENISIDTSNKQVADTSGKQTNITNSEQIDNAIVMKDSYLEKFNEAIADINKYNTILDDTISRIIKHYNKLQLEDHTKNIITSGNNLLTTGSNLLYSLKSHVKLLETLLSDCYDFVEEVKEDLSQPRRKEDFVYMSSNGMLSYAGRDLIRNEVKKEVNVLQDVSVKQEQEEKKPLIKYERVLISEIGYYLKLPVVTDLKHIPSALYYLKNSSSDSDSCNNVTANNVAANNVVANSIHSNNTDNNISNISTNKRNNTAITTVTTSKQNTVKHNTKTEKVRSGVYINLGNGNYARIPFPEIIDSKKEYDRKHSIRCKYSTKKECDEQRYKMSRFHNTQIRICNFAHEGDAIIKIGYPSRCPAIPNFGNPSTISSDIKNINMSDAKNLLMYGLSDIINSIIWFDYTAQKDNIFDKLESA